MLKIIDKISLSKRNVIIVGDDLKLNKLIFDRLKTKDNLCITDKLHFKQEIEEDLTRDGLIREADKIIFNDKYEHNTLSFFLENDMEYKSILVAVLSLFNANERRVIVSSHSDVFFYNFINEIIETLNYYNHNSVPIENLSLEVEKAFNDTIIVLLSNFKAGEKQHIAIEVSEAKYENNDLKLKSIYQYDFNTHTHIKVNKETLF